ncbi:primosomal replication protein PriC [Thalassotalea profundi]|uniref:Primosomal protein N n=1 Tax=Thalassotalea profundi TaxID=2036687 RepID=A0ABQ3IYI0_9GAMM|nr:primosomal replication protein PriC [Thalassotalea profundi]GHE98285.1 primosomal protein N' [Thalassotalea profundi]
MLTSHAIRKIETVLAGLLIQAEQIDQKNKSNKAFKLRKDSHLFAETLFITNSEFLVPYVQEIQKKCNELQRLLQENKSELSQHRLTLIEQQISSIITTIEANSSINKTDNITLNANKQRNYKKAAQSLFKPIQSLYSKLSETIEFERRLLVMLAEKQECLKVASPTKHAQATNDVLIVHQRLGRCRQAISKIERQIEMQEKR